MAINYELINKGGISLSTNFELLSDKPLDARQSVPTLEGLQNLIDNGAAYEGMVVYVSNQKTHYKVQLTEENTVSYRELNLTEVELKDLIASATGDSFKETSNAIETLKTGLTNTLSEAKTELTTKIENDDTAILTSAKAYTDEQVAAEAKLRSDADTALDERLGVVEDRVTAFFNGAAKDGEGLNNALDTLKDIQDYLSGDGEVAGGLVGQVAENARAIETLEVTLAEGGDFEKKVAKNTTDIAANASAIAQEVTARATAVENAITEAKAYTDEVVGTWTTGTADQEGYVEATGLRKEIEEAIAQKAVTVDKLTTVLPDALDQTLLKTNTIKTVADTAFSAAYDEEEETLTLTAISSNLSTQQ